jgi:proteasome accessory factor C
MPKVEFDSDDIFNLALSLVGLVLKDGPMTLEELETYFKMPRKTLIRAAKAIGNSEDLYRYESHFYLDDDLLEEEGIIDFSVGLAVLDSPPPLSRSQATALATGLDYLASLPQFAGNADLADLRKLFSQSDLPQPIVLEPNPLTETLELIRSSIVNCTRVEMTYKNQTGESSERAVDPLRIDFVGKRYYLRGYCLKSQELRSFRIDRISQISATKIPLSQEGAAAQIPDAIYGENPGNYTVEIKVEPHAYEIFWNFPTQGAPKQLPDGSFVGSIRMGNPGALARHVVRYGGAVRVLAPEQARQAVSNFAKLALGQARMKDD